MFVVNGSYRFIRIDRSNINPASDSICFLLFHGQWRSMLHDWILWFVFKDPTNYDQKIMN